MGFALLQETSADYHQVYKLVKQAFAALEISDKTERFLVEK